MASKQLLPYLAPKNWWIPVIVVLVTALTLKGVLLLGFTNWDDPVYVLENSLIRNLKNDGMFTQFVSGNYHPLTLISLAIDYSKGKLNPEGYHFTNYIFHILNTLLVFWIILRINSNNPYLAGVCALLFGVHPLHIESVAWISERKDVLYSFFWLAAWLFYLQYRYTGKVIYFFITHLLFIFSCLSKAMAVTLPLVLLLSDLLLQRKWSWRWLKEKSLLGLIALGTGILAIRAQNSASAIGAPADYLYFDHLLVACHGFLFYLFKGLVPLQLSALYPYPPKIDGWLPWPFLIAPVLVLLIGGILIYLKKTINSDWLPFGISLMVITLLPVLQLLPVGNAFAADRYFYLPSIGYFILLSALINYLYEKLPQLKYLLTALVFGYIGFCIYLSLKRIPVWKDTFSLFTDVSQKFPQHPEGWNNLGIAYSDAGNYKEAINHYLRVIKINPEFGLTLNNIGNAYGQLGILDSSIYYLEKSIRINPGNARAYSNLGNAYAIKGRSEEAQKAFEKAIQLDPNFHEPYHNLGAFYAIQGKYDIALPYFKKSIEKLIDYKDGWFGLGITYQALGDTVAANQALLKAAQLGHPKAQELMR